MIRRLSSKFRLFRRDCRGVTALEFALGGPVLLLMIAAIIEFGMIMLVTVMLEGSLREASRYGITGQQPTAAARMARIRSIVAEHTYGLVDMNEAKLEVLVYPSFGDIGRGEDYVDGNANGAYDSGETFTDENGNGVWDDDVGVSGPGDSQDIVVYRIHYDWPLMTPLLDKVIGSNGAFPLQASVAVRNEPWKVGS
jgi:Flp pilus assembly protein TadG